MPGTGVAEKTGMVRRGRRDWVEEMDKQSLCFSFTCFGPILVLLAPAAVVLFPMAGLNALASAFDPAASLSGALSLGVWSLIPILLAVVILETGYWLYQRGFSRALLVFLMGFFFFLASWMDLTLLGSISASDKPPLIYLRSTALVAAAITLIGQLGLVSWAGYVLRSMERGVQEKETGIRRRG